MSQRIDVDTDRFPDAQPSEAYTQERVTEVRGFPSNPIGSYGVGMNQRRGSALREDLRYERARAIDYEDAVARVRKNVADVLSYHKWGANEQRASDAVNVHLAAAMEAVVLNVAPCRDREEAVRALSMVRMLVNRALTLGDAI
jgi:hypothetical protein